MSMSKIAGIAVTTLLVVSPAVFAQGDEPATPTQQPTVQQPTAQPPTTQTPRKTIDTDTAALQTFTGCVMSEPAYRKAHNLGAGTVAGLGLADEFVLVDAK